MIVIDQNERIGANTVAALGLFDGVHLGHRRVLAAAKKRARELHALPAVFTFDTLSVTSKGRLDALLTNDDKIARFEELGMEYVCEADFGALKEQSPEEFVEDILIGRMHCVCAVCGYDFTFGKGGCANAADLERLCKERGIEALTVSQLSIGGEAVSSTRIRELIRNGEIAHANALLGSRWQITAKVEHGAELGRTWNFPTINQPIPDGLAVPRFGVYCSKVCVDGKWLAGVTNIGVKPTVGSRERPLAETFILDYDGDLYGRVLTTELYEFVRPEQRFASFSDLREEIGRNTDHTKRYFETVK
ncbi:riboflavin kinase / FMN adenylyltransferase [Ruminococcus sp. YE71]|uniref:riboflavin biosynthesis protein RibF n=1 Tax=unclassified Ruminococcus TaxID=2608920 RepID=UPI0008836BED|nr:MULTISPECIES: riboflavin biosynthesis protein RibF [unclassified Ruminococcus]SDA22847.1 riboflavin kinase / FMN adenylyltransferase [Ruminococcus sp. YE78]SFW38896.1 riboflavin kinase / FMN adenylyltransferase [Ruminococcus sp. YE71]